MFICSCFIRKNTQELKEKLRDLGYRFRGKTRLNCEFTSLYCINGLFFECSDKPSRLHEIIDCGDNEELFLAVSALRDDTDKNQWFVLETNLSSTDNPNDIYNKSGDFVLCTNDRWFVDYNEDGTPSAFSNRNIPAHKATIKELVEYYNLNNDTYERI